MPVEIICQHTGNIYGCDHIIDQEKNRNQEGEKTFQEPKFKLPKDQDQIQYLKQKN